MLLIKFEIGGKTSGTWTNNFILNWCVQNCGGSSALPVVDFEKAAYDNTESQAIGPFQTGTFWISTALVK